MKTRIAITLPTLLISIMPVLVIQAQDASMNGMAQQRAQELRHSVANNRKALMKYQWLQNTQVNIKGETKKDTTQMCRYGPDGQVQKTPVGPPPAPPQIPTSGLKGKIAQKKMAEMQDYTTRLKSLIGHYAPPNPEMMRDAIQAGKVSLTAQGGIATVNFANYYKQGDNVAFAFDTGTKKLQSHNFNTYLDDPKKDIVTMTNQFASLPDGTNYVQQTVVDATSKQIQVTTTNSNYTPVGQ